MTATAIQRELTWSVGALRGLSCWQVVAGRNIGSTFILDFGKRQLRRKRPGAAKPAYRGEFVLSVEGPWRINVGRRRVAAWTDAIDGRDEMIARLKALKGNRVLRAHLRLPQLRIVFENGYALVMFADLPNCAGDPLFEFDTPQGHWIVLNSGAIRDEGRSGKLPMTVN